MDLCQPVRIKSTARSLFTLLAIAPKLSEKWSRPDSLLQSVKVLLPLFRQRTFVVLAEPGRRGKLLDFLDRIIGEAGGVEIEVAIVIVIDEGEAHYKAVHMDA